MSRTCSYCYYLITEQVSFCAKCKSHPYCSRNCQKKDWKLHKLWCCFPKQVGELDVDFKIKESDNDEKGLGIFAMRDFSPGDNILVERPIIKYKTEGVEGTDIQIVINNLFLKLNQSIQSAIMKLHPRSSNIVMEKFLDNNFRIEDRGINILLITGSIFNNSCLPNCDRSYIEEQDLFIFSANQQISKGDEIYIAYGFLEEGQSLLDYQSRIKRIWKFTCDCPACRDPVIGEAFFSIKQSTLRFLALIKDLTIDTNVDEAYVLGKQLISLYKEFKYSNEIFVTVYGGMFSICSTKRKMELDANEATEYINLSLKHVIMQKGGSKPESKDIKYIRDFVDYVETANRLYPLNQQKQIKF